MVTLWIAAALIALSKAGFCRSSFLTETPKSGGISVRLSQFKLLFLGGSDSYGMSYSPVKVKTINKVLLED